MSIYDYETFEIQNLLDATKLKKNILVESLMCMNQRIEQQTIDNKENLKFIIYYTPLWTMS